MSTRAERRRHELQRKNSPNNPGGVIAAVVAVVALIAIISYGVLQRNAQVTGAAVAPQAQPSIPPPTAVGLKAPPFSIEAKGGVISSQTFAGKPFLLELFATWCPHCQRMTSVLRDLRRKFPPSRFGMLSVTGSPFSAASTPDRMLPEDQADVDTFDTSYKVTWPSAFDKDLTVARTWGLNGFPTIYVVDGHGTVEYVHSGEIEEKTLISAIHKAGA